MDKYIYQKFLLNCDYESIELHDFPFFEGNIDDVLDYHHDYCIFDIGKDVIRKIDIAEIDDRVDTEEDWNNLVNMLCEVDSVVLYNYGVNATNLIINRYRETTLKAYLYRLLKSNTKIYLEQA